MSAPRKQQNQVSLRGASAKEITRDALLQKVSHERELRSFTRRASAAALSIQRVWRRYYVMKTVAKQLQEEWTALASSRGHHRSSAWISSNLIRPFLFFTKPSTLRQKLRITNVECMLTCFRILLQSINSADMEENFCSLAMEEKSVWLYQTQKLLTLCSFILAECDCTCHDYEDMVPLTALAMRLVVTLTDPKGWKSFKCENTRDADIAVKKLIGFMSTSSTIYICMRRYFMNLGIHVSSEKKTNTSADDNFLITASAITLALRPFHSTKLDATVDDLLDVKDASEKYFIFILTVPHLTKCLPPLLLPALKHRAALLPCLRILLVLADFQG